MDLKIGFPGKNGINKIVGSDNALIKKIILNVVRLNAGEEHEGNYPKHETVIVVLGGKCSVSAGDKVFEGIGERENVFQGRAYAVYMPFDTPFKIKADTKCEVAICGSPASEKKDIVLITPGDNKTKSVGKANWQRNVYDIVDLSVDAERIILGETINPPGNWSSAPPHRHEKDNLPEESKLEEIYFFKLNPEKGFGVQRVYTDDYSLNETYTLENNDTLLIPRGYHPVAAAPGYELYYLWILAGNKRVMKVKDDPKHAWLKDT